MIKSYIKFPRLAQFLLQRILHPGSLYYPMRVLDKLLINSNHCFYISTTSGLKFMGKGMTSQQLMPFILETEIHADKYGELENWRINPDFLTDPHSLTGLPIKQSPHYQLISALANRQNLKETEYAYRMQRGLLDLRRGGPLPIDFMSKRFKMQFDQFQEGQKFCIKGFLITLNGEQSLVIADGKHTVAMAAYFGFESCLEIALLSPTLYQTPFFAGLITKLHKQANLYSKNIQILKAIHEFNTQPNQRH